MYVARMNGWLSEEEKPRNEHFERTAATVRNDA